MDIQKEREAFEKECRLLCYEGNMVMSNLGSFYNNEQTNWMWQMWLSSKSQAVPETKKFNLDEFLEMEQKLDSKDGVITADLDRFTAYAEMVLEKAKAQEPK